MNTKRKYLKTTGYWVYGHITPSGKIYIGYSKQEISQRWKPSHYKNCSLEFYIEKYGWGNIRHIVFKDGLTQKQAEVLEDLLITQANIDGWCLNQRGSGGYRRDNRKEYDKQCYEEHKEEILEKRKQYYEEHRDKKKQYREDHKEEKREYDKQLRSTPEGKIYGRVHSFNQRHPDRKIETPKEAKNKYLEYGYIPSYIKNDDLNK